MYNVCYSLLGWSLSEAISKHLVCITYIYTATSFQFSMGTSCWFRYIHMTICYSFVRASLEKGMGEKEREREREEGDAGWAQARLLSARPCTTVIKGQYSTLDRRTVYSDVGFM